MTSGADAVVVEREGPVAVLRLDRPKAMNSFDVATDEALLAAVRGLVHDDSVRAVVLTGTGKTFCTGGDVAEMHARAHDAARLFDELTVPYHAMVLAMQQSDKVFVAAVNGIAAGGGVGLALSCDLVVMARSARFVLAYGNIGISPDGGATAHLVRALGPHRAREAVLVDGGITSEQALAWGLTNRVVDDGEVGAAAKALAVQVAGRAVHTVRETKRLVELAAHSPLERTLEAERRAIIEAGGTADFREGIEAFFAKRKPVFGGAQRR